MQSVTLIRDPLSPPEDWERAEVEDARGWLMERFDEWPSSARIYHGVPGMDRDVTPASEGDVERLVGFDELTVIVYPGDPITAIIVVVAVIVGVVASFLLMPKIPTLGLDNRQQQSPNNGLSARSNKARPNQRICDIFGTVRSIPDLIAAPYRVYDTNRELEIAYMCIGRGAYDVSDVRDGDTLISEIDLASATVYAPYSSPNDFTVPQLQIGPVIGDPVFDVSRLNEVNGQTMLSTNNKVLATTRDLRFVDGGIIRSASGAIDFTDYFMAGDLIDIDRAHDTGGDPGTDGKHASATAHAHGFDFTTYDPTPDFTVGRWVSVVNAVYQVDDGGTSGEIAGGTDYPDPPYDPYCVDWNEPLLLANEARDGPGEAKPIRDCDPETDWVWTRHYNTCEWGAYRLTGLTFVERTVMEAEADVPLATPGHRFGDGLDAETWGGGWLRMERLGRQIGVQKVGLLTVAGAHTYVTVRPSGRLVLSHNRKLYYDTFA